MRPALRGCHDGGQTSSITAAAIYADGLSSLPSVALMMRRQRLPCLHINVLGDGVAVMLCDGGKSESAFAFIARTSTSFSRRMQRRSISTAWRHAVRLGFSLAISSADTGDRLPAEFRGSIGAE
jgi:hypothetical protein